jgi:transcription-repair coupling factor (superfamily II helicase)
VSRTQLAAHFGQLAAQSLPQPGGVCAVEGLTGCAPYLWLSAVLARTERPVFFITENNDQAEQALVYFQSAARLSGLDIAEDGAVLYQDFECSSLLDFTPLTEAQKEQVLKAQRGLLAGEARAVFLPYRALFRRTVGREIIQSSSLVLRARDEMPLGELTELLVDYGYEPRTTVTAKGEMARRGGLVDVFPFGSYYPVRLDFFGDEIESIKSFDPATQRSVEAVDEIEILPASPAKRILAQPYALDAIHSHLRRYRREKASAAGESGLQTLEAAIAEDLEAIKDGRITPRQEFYLELAGGRGETILHFAETPPLLVFLEHALLENETRSYRRFWESRFRDWHENGLTFTYFSDYYTFPDKPLPQWLRAPGALSEELGLDFAQYPAVFLYAFQSGDERTAYDEVATADLERLPPGAYTTGEMAKTIGESPAHHLVMSQFARRISEILEEAGARAEVLPGLLPQGFTLTEGGAEIALVTDVEVFGELAEVVRKPAKRYTREYVRHEGELNPGDFVVHIDYGIGRFAALKELEAKGVQRMYVELEYADGDRLYVPVDQLDRLRPYRAAGQAKLSSLQRDTWHRTKQKVQQDVLMYARKLFKLYRSRRTQEGFAYRKNDWMEDFTEGFPYELTPDQFEAWEAVKRDLESAKAMDRLICGEVGFGKTEIALRAAFKACLSGKQVLMLCPTTILASQHHHTFTQRFRPFPFTVELLSRFRKPAEQKQIVEAAAAGKVDVLISTHRCLSKDVEFANLGLLVVDEEQRFGVKQKEALKMRFPQIDVLTLTATPIPRTLRLSLLGLMDVSLLETPPPLRKAVKTYVGEYNESIVRDAILKETGRGGQVYFLHNRVQDIHVVAKHLQELVPGLKVGVAHGQLPEKRLEEMMDAFGMGAFQVLLATTIIENGLDIPTVNTLIVDRGEILGLAQMHQLRGRVGRSHQKAYSYFFHSPQSVLTDEARDRLRAIYNYAYLGAGYEIAQQDLLIRGAGTILGTDQSGSIELVGMDYYLELLTEAVERLKELPDDFGGEGAVQWESDLKGVQVDLPLACFIPEDYIADMPLRLRIYQRIAEAKTDEEVLALQEELEDRFGALPPTVENLFHVQDLKLLCRAIGVQQISYLPAQAKLTLAFGADEPRPWLRKLALLDSRVSTVLGNGGGRAARGPGRHSVSDGGARSSTAALPPGEHITARIPKDARFLEEVRELLERIQKLME